MSILPEKNRRPECCWICQKAGGVPSGCARRRENGNPRRSSTTPAAAFGSTAPLLTTTSPCASIGFDTHCSSRRKETHPLGVRQSSGRFWQTAPRNRKRQAPGAVQQFGYFLVTFSSPCCSNKQ